MYAGAGGSGVRISSVSAPRSFSSAGAGFSAGGAGFNLADAVDNASDISGSKKAAMQNLNDRLAAYLEKVRKLEAANGELELKIRQFLEKKTQPEGHDCAAFKVVISDLQDQVSPGSDSVMRSERQKRGRGVRAGETEDRVCFMFGNKNTLAQFHPDCHEKPGGCTQVFSPPGTET